MKIKIDCELLNEQIKMCDTHAINASSEYESDLFDGIATLLSDICYALENDESIEFLTT